MTIQKKQVLFGIVLALSYLCNVKRRKQARIYDDMRLLFVFFTLLMGFPVHAQEYAQITHFGVEEGLMEHTVSSGMQDSFGYIWFSTHNGLVRYDGCRFVTYKARPGDHCPLTTNMIDYVEELPDHDILCLSKQAFYVFHRNTATFEFLRPDTTHAPHDDTVDPIIAERISKLKEFEGVDYKIRLIDRQGGVWVRSSRGMERVTFVRRPIKTLKFNTEEPEEYVRALMTDKQGRLWIADRNKYVRVLSSDHQTVMYLTPSGQLTRQSTRFGCGVCTMLEDSRGRIWLGSRKQGLFLLVPHGQDRYDIRQYCQNPQEPNGLNDSTVCAVLEDSRRRIWVGCYDGGGLNLVKEQNGLPVGFVNMDNGLKNYPREVGGRVRCLRLLGDTLLVGTNLGLLTALIQEKARDITFFTNQRNSADASSLSNNRVMGIETDGKGHVFLATHGGGICVTRTDSLLSNHIRFSTLSSENGLPSDVCQDICRDNKGQIWVNSEYMLSQINADERTFTNYRKSLFEGGFLFTEADPRCLADGTLIFGTTQGILHFNLDDIRKSTFVPPIMMELQREDGSIIPCPDQLTLSADEKNFQLLLAALDYNRHEKIYYAYRLEDVDQDWHYTNEPLITYTSFPPGTYRLHVKSTNGDGLWVDNEKVITIYRRASFNESPYSGMLYGVLIVLFCLAVAYTIRYIRMLQKEMSSYKLATREKIEYMEIRMQELMNPKADMVQNDEAARDKFSETQKADYAELEEADDEDERVFRERVEAMVRRQISNSDLVIDDCAREMLMSRSAFYLRIKKNYGVSPNTYIQNIRLDYAMKLLRDTNDTISEVAYEAGYTDPKYFSRAFKKAKGLTPTEFRDSARA